MSDLLKSLSRPRYYNGAAWSGLRRDDKAFAFEVNVPVAGAAVSPGGDKYGVAIVGGIYCGLDRGTCRRRNIPSGGMDQ